MPVPEIRADGSIKPGKYFLGIDETLHVEKPVNAVGVEIIKAAIQSPELKPAVKLTSGGRLSDLSIKYAGSYQVGAIETEGEQMVLENVHVSGGYAGDPGKPGQGDEYRELPCFRVFPQLVFGSARQWLQTATQFL